MEEKLALYQAQELQIKQELKRQALLKFEEDFKALNTTIPDISPNQLRTKEKVPIKKIDLVNGPDKLVEPIEKEEQPHP